MRVRARGGEVDERHYIPSFPWSGADEGKGGRTRRRGVRFPPRSPLFLYLNCISVLLISA